MRTRADAGDRDVAVELTELLAQRGDLDGLRAWADAGDNEVAMLLAERGDLDELRARADAGDGSAARRLPDLMAKQGRGEEATRLRRFGLNRGAGNNGPVSTAKASSFLNAAGTTPIPTGGTADLRAAAAHLTLRYLAVRYRNHAMPKPSANTR